MLGKFCAVIDGQRVDLFSVVLQPLNEVICDFLGLLGVDALQTRPPTLAVDQRCEGTAPLAAYPKIAFPVADACFLLDDGRTVVNRDPVG